MFVVALQHGQKSRLRLWKCVALLSASSGRVPEKCCSRHRDATRSNPMMDVLMLALGFAFFALAIGYTFACELL